MGTYQHSPKHLFHKAVYIIVALGLVVGGFFTYKASQMSTEDRSKAALEYTIYKQWEFEGTDTEGWMGLNLTNVKVGDHLLKGIVGARKEYPKLLHKTVSLDKGNKVFEISVLVAPARKPIIGATPIVEPYTLNVVYGNSDNRDKRRQLVITGKTDGQLHNFAAKFPEIGSLDIDNLALEFVNVKGDSTIAVDWIRITDRVGTKVSPTPTPLPGLVTCRSLYKEKSSYFKSCSDNGYTRVCFNKFTTEYQGCNKTGENTCTENNVNAANNILCDSSPK